jgi:hypothetical protein
MKLKVSANGRYFETVDGRPWFWLADTAWNGALRGDTDEWVRYLDLRVSQGFAAVQFVTGPWRGCRSPRHGRTWEVVDGKLRFNEGALAKMDEWFTLMASRGLVPSPVMVWDNNPADPFFDWSEETCIAVGRMMVERWASFDPVWILAGDGDYRSDAQAARWKRIGRAVFGEQAPAGTLATMHPCGVSWVGDLFAGEPWYSFVGVQSGHGSVDHDLDFLVAGPYSYRWYEIEKPFINMEPNYELARSYHEEVALTDYHVRRVAYWSLLGAPTAGLTYGNNNIWVWAQAEGEQAEGHGAIWVAGKWTAGLETPGVASLTVMRRIFDRLGWSDLVPSRELLALQPGWADPNRFLSCAAKRDGTLLVAYLPVGGKVRFTGAVPVRDLPARWVDPRTGDESPATFDARSESAAPDERDWLLVLGER